MENLYWVSKNETNSADYSSQHEHLQKVQVETKKTNVPILK